MLTVEHVHPKNFGIPSDKFCSARFVNRWECKPCWIKFYKRCSQFGRVLVSGDVGHLWASNTTEIDSSSRDSLLGAQNFQKKFPNPSLKISIFGAQALRAGFGSRGPLLGVKCYQTLCYLKGFIFGRINLPNLNPEKETHKYR